MKRKLLILLFVLASLQLAAACEKTQRPPFLPPPGSSPPVEMIWEVRADYSNLTPYAPYSMCSRLREGPLPELIPSPDYGMLLPYASSIVLADGGIRAVKYGLVASNGVIVTDLVYDRLDRAYSTYSYTQKPQPAYKLSRDIPGTETDWGSQSMLAACALDGSWITGFDYSDIIFTEKAIVLMRSYDSYDIDVYDYNGRLIYNMLDLEWTGKIRKDTWPGSLVYSISEGYGSIQTSDGTYAYINILTGRATYTEYTGAFPFLSGRASVAQWDKHGAIPELWGAIGPDFRLNIPVKYVNPIVFINGRALAETPDGRWHIININGETLLSAPDGRHLEQHYDGSGFTLHPEPGGEMPVFYTIDLVEIPVPDEARNAGYMTSLYQLGDGWFYCSAADGAVLFTLFEKHFIPGAGHIIFFDGEYVVYSWNSRSGNGVGVIALDGREIVPSEPNIMITAVAEEGAAKAFVVNKGPSMYAFTVGPYIHSGYRLVGLDGDIIRSGPGVLTYDEAAGLYSVLDADNYIWLDKDGNIIINIPVMSYTMD